MSERRKPCGYCCDPNPCGDPTCPVWDCDVCLAYGETLDEPHPECLESVAEYERQCELERDLAGPAKDTPA